MLLIAGVSLLGGVGALARYLTDHAITGLLGRTFPWGTCVVNIVGCGLAGVVLGATTYQSVTPQAATLLLAGLLGGFTTASTLSLEVARLVASRRVVAGLTVAVGTMVASVATGLAGLIIGGGG